MSRAPCWPRGENMDSHELKVLTAPPVKMKPLFCSESKIIFDKLREDVIRLNEIHSDISGDQKGRKWGVEVLNRASIVFICACWESYVENLVSELFALMIKKATTP